MTAVLKGLLCWLLWGLMTHAPAFATPAELDWTAHLSGSALGAQQPGICLVGRPAVLTLEPQASLATYMSPVQVAPFPFRVALPSWNGYAPQGAGFRIALRARAPGATWTPWLEVGSWGPTLPSRTNLATSSPAARVDIDTLVLKTPAREYQWRVDLAREETHASPQLRRLSICLTGSTSAAALAWFKARAAMPHMPEGALAIPAPFRGQLTSNPALTGRICSPCTVASALGAYGIEIPTEDVAERLYDAEHDMYGVWPRAIQGAADYGVDGYVTRLRSFGELRAHLAAGRVVGASIKFKAGTLKNPPYPSTNGHLILIRGITAQGDVITNDSYRAKDGDGKVWNRDDLARAWFGSGGVAYVFERPESR